MKTALVLALMASTIVFLFWENAERKVEIARLDARAASQDSLTHVCLNDHSEARTAASAANWTLTRANEMMDVVDVKLPNYKTKGKPNDHGKNKGSAVHAENSLP